MQPVQAAAARPELRAGSTVWASILLAGFSRLFSVLGPAWPEMWGQAHRAASERAGVEEASRNERPAGRGESASEEALSQATLFSFRTGPGHEPASAIHPPLTSEVTPFPQGSTGKFNKVGGHQACGWVGGWREVRELLGGRNGGEPVKDKWTTRGQPCPPRMRGLQALAVKVPVTSPG